MIKLNSVPVAEDVSILGSSIVGGTLNASYKYFHPENVSEGDSNFSWIVSGVEVATTSSLSMIQDYAGKEVNVTVVPVSANGEAGAPVTSPSKEVVSGFQNITDEENENSFMKQHGNFSFYRTEPSDRIFVSTGGAFSLLDASTQNTYVHGQRDYGAVVPEAIKGYLVNNPALVLFSTERDFAALVPLGQKNQLLAWGFNIPTNLDTRKLRNIRSVYSNGSAFAFIYNEPNEDNHSIGAIGLAGAGGSVPQEIQLKLLNDAPVAIYATSQAFAVLTTKGKVYAWGSQASGGIIKPQEQERLDGMKVKRIISNMTAFCAIGEDDQIVPWGATTTGGVIPADRLASILNQGGVKSVIASRAAFCAITKGRAIAVSWGLATQGGDMSAAAADLAARGNIVLCKSANWAFSMVNASGVLGAWGVAASGGTPPPMVRSESNFQVNGEKKVEVFADTESYFRSKLVSERNPSTQALEAAADEFSRQITTVTSSLKFVDGVVSIYGNDRSFFCLAQDDDQFTEGLWAWGEVNLGGSLPADIRQVLMASRVRSVYCTNGAYATILSQGATEGVVLVWGASLAHLDAGEIPKTPPEIAEFLRRGIIEIYSIKRTPPLNPTPGRTDPSFAARHISGNYVLWGGNVDNQVFTPSEQD